MCSRIYNIIFFWKPIPSVQQDALRYLSGHTTRSEMPQNRATHMHTHTCCIDIDRYTWHVPRPIFRCRRTLLHLQTPNSLDSWIPCFVTRRRTKLQHWKNAQGKPAELLTYRDETRRLKRLPSITCTTLLAPDPHIHEESEICPTDEWINWNYILCNI